MTTMMMKKLVLSALVATLPGAVLANAVVGQPAPAFNVTDTSGKAVSLADYKGKTVVLEWVNPGCPYVRKHYDSANMQATQKGAAGQGVVWLAVNSTHASHYDYKKPADMAAWMKSQNAAPTTTLVDSEGKIGRAYGARTTPHMYIVDAKGTLVYAGGIDDKPSTDQADIAGAKNFVAAALDEALAGKPVTVATSTPYGCAVKY
jgi:hypothetical protein